jgi:hypothetical protein
MAGVRSVDDEEKEKLGTTGAAASRRKTIGATRPTASCVNFLC